MTDLALEGALQIVARHVLSAAAENAVDTWESYPEIGENDWARIADILTEELAPYPATMDYDAAFDFLAKRGESGGDR